MKILLISVRSDLSGGPVHVRDLAESLRRQGHTVFVAAPEGEHFSEDFRRLSEGFFRLPRRRFSVTRFLCLRSFMVRNAIEVVHSHGRGAGVYSRLLRLFSKRPIVHTFHGLHVQPGFVAGLKLAADRFLQPLTDLFVFVSEDERKKGLRHRVATDARSKVILNGIRLERFQSRPLAPLPARPRVGVVARPDPVKGLDLLALELPALTTASAASVVLAGVSPEHWRTFDPEGRFPFVLPLGTCHMEDFLNRIDLLASFSREEGLPLSVLEAAQAGLPLLLSEIEGHRYFREFAATFDASTPGEFSAALGRLLADPRGTLARVRRGRELVAKNHSIEKMTDELVAAYRALTARE